MGDEMKPGRELDVLVAEKVMGLEPWPGKRGMFKASLVPNGTEPKPCIPPEYSTDIAAAWEVVEKIRSNLEYSGFSLHTPGGYDRHRHFGATFEKEWTDRIGENHSSNSVYAIGDTAPHAICLAALKTADAI